MYMDSYLQEGEILLAQKQDLNQAVSLLEEYNRQAKNPADIHYFWGIWSLAKAYRTIGNLPAYQREVTRIKKQNYQQNKEFTLQFERAIKRDNITQ